MGLYMSRSGNSRTPDSSISPKKKKKKREMGAEASRTKLDSKGVRSINSEAAISVAPSKKPLVKEGLLSLLVYPTARKGSIHPRVNSHRLRSQFF